MILIIHFATSAVLALFLYPYYGATALFVLVGGFLIDIDHYLYTIFKFRNLNIYNSYRFCRNFRKQIQSGKSKDVLLIFHNIEFLLMMIILSFFSTISLLITMGIILHYFLDFVDQYSSLGRVIIPVSIILWLLRKPQII